LLIYEEEIKTLIQFLNPLALAGGILLTSDFLFLTSVKMMELFLQQVSTDFDQYFIIMQVDRASWHISDKLNLPDNIRLIPQTPRSPELNPVEHLWEAIRENYFYNEVFESLEKVIDTLCEGLNFFNSVPEQLKSMTYFPHLRITF
nr:hypothetical protein [Pleurocapsa sp. MO_192.B19]